MSDAFGVIAPHAPIMVAAVGGARADVTRASLDALARIAAAIERYRPHVMIVISPHAPAVFDAFAVDTSSEFVGTFASFGSGGRAYSYVGDPKVARAILKKLGDRDLLSVERGVDYRLEPGTLDHGALVPLTFLQPSGTVPIVVVSYSGMDYDAFRGLGESIREAVEETGRRAVLVSSGDLSHRLTPDAPAGYSAQAADLDDAIVEAVRGGRFGDLPSIDPELVEAGGECGLRSFVAMGGYMGQDPVPTQVLSYEGPWGVGYLTALVGQTALDADAKTETHERGEKGGSAGRDQSEIVRLARSAIEAFIRDGHTLDPGPLVEDDLPAKAGAFVTLHRGGELRGCIGTILPTRDTLAQEVVGNAIQAATRDPRFPPLAEDELADLDVKVDVLHPPEACDIEDLDPERYGVIATSGWRRGLLLPDLEGVDDVGTQIEIAMRKGGILPHEPCSFERFRVDRYT